MAAQMEHGSTAFPGQAAAAVSETTQNRTFLLAAKIAEHCQHRCELRLRHLDRGRSASAVFAAAPLLSVNTLKLLLPTKQGCSFSLEAACSGNNCQASGQVVVDDVVLLQQYAASADRDSDSTGTAVAVLPQRIVVQHVAGDAVPTLTGVNAHQSMQLGAMSTTQLALSAVCVMVLLGLQGCLLHRVRDQGKSQDTELVTRMQA